MSPSPVPDATADAISVLVADSNRMQAQLLTSALRRRPEFRIATCRMETTSLLHAIASSPPKVVLLSPDAAVGAGENMAILRGFHHANPEITTVLLVDSFDRALVVDAFRSGVKGIFCIADGNLRVLCKCIQRVAEGQIWANAEQMNYLLDLIAEVPSLRVFSSRGEQLLTPREEQVVALVAEGLGNRLIARELNLSEHTVKKYLFRIFEKLGISTRVELVLYAVNHSGPQQREWPLGGGGAVPVA
jgi:DNA-binding NarL/FixJ family response regulator